MLQIRNLTKRFGEKVAVNDVSLDITPGEILALIGPNGSGKTTIVKSIVGIFAADEGSIVVDGKDARKDPMEAKARIGYIPDEPVVWSGMTGEEFLHFIGALYHVPPKERSARIGQLLPKFSLDSIANESFEEYSRGNKQKFSILAALLHQPKLLLVDEPIVGLDPESAEIAKRLFVDFAKNGGSVLLVTHTLPVAQEIATRIGLLQGGVLRAIGTMDTLRHEAGVAMDAPPGEVYARLARN